MFNLREIAEVSHQAASVNSVRPADCGRVVATEEFLLIPAHFAAEFREIPAEPADTIHRHPLVIVQMPFVKEPVLQITGFQGFMEAAMHQLGESAILPTKSKYVIPAQTVIEWNCTSALKQM